MAGNPYDPCLCGEIPNDPDYVCAFCKEKGVVRTPKPMTIREKVEGIIGCFIILAVLAWGVWDCAKGK